MYQINPKIAGQAMIKITAVRLVTVRLLRHGIGYGVQVTIPSRAPFGRPPL
jgi:hypothetical protein